MATSPKSKATISKKSVAKSRVNQQGKSSLSKTKFSKKFIALFALLFAGVGVFVVYYSQAATVPVNGRLLTTRDETPWDKVFTQPKPVLSTDNVQPAFVPAPKSVDWMTAINAYGSSQRLDLRTSPQNHVSVSNNGDTTYLLLSFYDSASNNVAYSKINAYNSIDGSNKREIVSLKTQEAGLNPYIDSFSLSMDGNTIAYHVMKNEPNNKYSSRIYSVGVAGASPKGNGTATKELSDVTGANIGYEVVGFTQQGKVLYRFIDYSSGAANSATAGYYAISPDGTGREKLVGLSPARSELNLIIAPNGDRILRIDSTVYQNSLKVVKLDGSVVLNVPTAQVAKIMGQPYSLRNSSGWSPDGKYFYIGRMVVDAATGNIVANIPGPDNIIHWLPAQS